MSRKPTKIDDEGGSDLTWCECTLCERAFYTDDVESTKHQAPVSKYTTDLKDPATWVIGGHLSNPWHYDQEEVIHDIGWSHHYHYTLCPQCMERVKDEMPPVDLGDESKKTKRKRRP